jgi:hypothetical protein
MDQRTAFTVKANANSSPPLSTAERLHKFADCVHTLEDYIVPTVCLEYKSCKVYQQEFVTLQKNIHQVKLCQYSQK